MKNYKIKINDHKYVIKGLNVDIEGLVTKTLKLDEKVTAEMAVELLCKNLLSKLDNMTSGEFLAVNNEGLEYWDKHGIDPFENVKGAKIINSMFADLRSEIERQTEKPLKWFYEFDEMAKQIVKRYPNTGQLKDQLDNFEQATKSGEVVCLSDLMINAGM